MSERTKYVPGVEVGPYNSLLLEIVGRQPCGHKIGKFLCSFCKKNTFEANLYAVADGRSSQCKECHTKRLSGKNSVNFKDLTGHRFGKLVVAEYVGSKFMGYDKNKHKLTRSEWKCKCDCGRYIEKTCNELTKKDGSVSCGQCNLHSFGEYKIKTCLDELKIDYECQKGFSDLVNPKAKHNNGKLRFDFYLPKYNCCIEYDGTSHFYHNEYGSWNTPESVEDTQYRDGLKNQYCESHNIALIRITYKELEQISSSYIKRLLESIYFRKELEWHP